MDLTSGIVAITTAIGAFIGGAAAHFIAHDAYEAAPRYARKLIDRAVSRMPECDRARFAEQWLADLYEHEGVINKFRHAVGCVLAAGKVGAIRSAAKPRFVIEIDGVVEARVAACLGVLLSQLSERLQTGQPMERGVSKALFDSIREQLSEPVPPLSDFDALLRCLDVLGDSEIEKVSTEVDGNILTVRYTRAAKKN